MKRPLYAKKPAPKVFVGMSGGVDSSVAAALLKEVGYDVTGVFIKVWQPEFLDHCTAQDDRLDAMRVAALLDIPFITLDLEQAYKTEVVDYMIGEYKAGRTPNPDIMCNKHVKFGAFYTWARAHGAQYVATGHYARVGTRQEARNSKPEIRKKGSQNDWTATHYTLKASRDSNKDQSYFLWTLSSEILAHTLFPVGGLTKPKVRACAKRFSLATAEKKDSQGLCFIGKVDMKEFLSHYAKSVRGDVYNEAGEVIGYHDGVLFLTKGQRHGFTITRKTPLDAPYFIIAKDIEKNTIVVSHKRDEALATDSKVFTLKDVQLHIPPAEGAVLSARVRYRQELQTARVFYKKGAWEIHFDKLQTGTSGQSIVVYEKDTVVLGGVIV